MKDPQLSPTSLSLFQECPRCFWFQLVKGAKRPRGIFPSLPGGMDLVIKAYFDNWRKKGKLPPELTKEGIAGQLFPDQARLDQWRDWRSGLSFRDPKLGASLRGAMDDCLIQDECYVPMDYKTRGFPRKEDSESFYQLQLDCYAWLLEENGCKTNHTAYLVYYIPKAVAANGAVSFSVEPVKVDVKSEDARQLFKKAVGFLGGPEPKSEGACEYCAWAERRE